MVVVGAGPAGSALALQLARAGVAVELVESRNGHEQLSRGDGLMPSGLEALDQLGLGEALAALPQRPLRSWEFWLEQRPLFAVAEPIGGGRPCTLISTAALLQALLQEAQRHPSFHWHQGCGVDQLRFAPGRPDPAHAADEPAAERVVGVVLDDGSVLEADLVVACDGRGSLLRRRAGLERQEDATAVEALWFELEGEAAAALAPWLNGRFLTLVGQGGSLALFATAHGGLRLGWLAGGAAEGAAGGTALPWPERWARISPPELARLWRNLPDSAIPTPQRLVIRPALAEVWHRPGLLLLGDAAHPMSPLRAQGLNMALRDAVVAAELLVPLLKPCAGGEPTLGQLDHTLAEVARLRLPELRRIQAHQRQELGRARLLLERPWLRRLLAATADWSGPLLRRRWQAGQPTLRNGLPLP